MLAVHLENGRIEVRDEPRPHRPAGFALIRLLCGGICNTDLELQRGYYGFAGTPGHEFVGEVIEADSPAWVGRRVRGNFGKLDENDDDVITALADHALEAEKFSWDNL